MISGGQDSVALLHFLATGQAGKYGPASVCALHVNHHLRGAESDADEALVKEFCAELGVQLTVVHRPVDKKKGNVQEVARELRREAGLKAALELGCERIALGHTADDQVETVFYRLGRYGGLGALAAMRPSDPPWVRPFLLCRREETAAYCRVHGLAFASDSGNAYPGYVRTVIREEVMPAWERAVPGGVAAACRAAEVAGEMKELASWVVDKVLPQMGVSADSDVLQVDHLRMLLPAARRLLLHEWLERHGVRSASRAGVMAVESLLDRSGTAKCSVGGGWLAVREYEHLCLERESLPRNRIQVAGSARVCSWLANAPSPVLLPLPGEVSWGEVVLRAEYVDEFRLPASKDEAFVDAASLSEPLEVRGPRPGDRVWPLGAPGRRKLQDVFVDLRVPARRRGQVPLVVSGERIIWVAGLLSSEQGKIDFNTKAIVRFSLRANRGAGGFKEPQGDSGSRDPELGEGGGPHIGRGSAGED